MAYELNFAVLGAPVDIPGAVNRGYERGRTMRLQGQQERAFSLLARDPNSAEGRALLTSSGRPDLARQFRTWGIEDRRDVYNRAAFGGGGAPPSTAPAPSAFAPVAGPVGGAAPAAPAGPPAVAPMAPPVGPAAAPPASPAASGGPGQLNPALMRAFFAEDPEGATELLTRWRSLNDLQRAEQTRRFTAAVPILAEVARMPLAQRGPAIMAQADFLVSNGWSPEQIQNFAADPNDQSIRMLLRMGVPIAEQRQYFAPIEGGAGQVYRDPVTLGVDAANPSPPRTEVHYDQAGNELIQTVPGTPAIGPGAELFGTVPQMPTVEPAGEMDEAALRARAADAIRRGADPRRVNERLEQMLSGRGATSPTAAPAWPEPHLDERGAGLRPRTFP